MFTVLKVVQLILFGPDTQRNRTTGRLVALHTPIPIHSHSLATTNHAPPSAVAEEPVISIGSSLSAGTSWLLRNLTTWY